MPERKGELSANKVATLSKALRVRAAQIKKTTGNNPDQYKGESSINATSEDHSVTLLIAGQDKLIPEPAGEPGRDPATISKKTGKPRGYHLWAALGLKKGSPTHGLYRDIVKDSAVGINWKLPYRSQRQANRVATVAEVLQKEPIFHCYEDNWPVHAYMKGLLSSRADSQRKLRKRAAQEEEEMDIDTNSNTGNNGPENGDHPGQGAGIAATLDSKPAIDLTASAMPTAPSAAAPVSASAGNTNSPVPSVTNNVQFAATAVHVASEQFDKDQSSSSSDEDTDTPPTKRQRQNRKSNMPRARNPNGNALKPAAPSSATTSKGQNTESRPAEPGLSGSTTKVRV
ncbi:hypothetical protein RhiTH_007412 [Rhizoctonia solani]